MPLLCPVVLEMVQRALNNPMPKTNEEYIDKDHPNVFSASKVDRDTREEIDTHRAIG